MRNPILLFLSILVFSLILAVNVPEDRVEYLTASVTLTFLFAAYIVPAYLTYKKDVGLFLAATLLPAPIRMGTALGIFYISLHYYNADPLKLGLCVYGLWLPVLVAEIWILAILYPKEEK